MSASPLVDRLAAHRMLADVPIAQLQWLASNGHLEQFATGDIVVRTGELMPELFVVLSGHLAIEVKRGAATRKLTEWRGGDITGVIPFSRMTGAPGNVIAIEPSEVLMLHRDHFPRLIAECYELTSVLVHVMLDRARFFQSSDLQDEKLRSLGRLSAGLAHELNNPASAVARSAKSLAASLAHFDSASHALWTAGLSQTQAAIVERLRDAADTTVHELSSPLERFEREEAITAWLERRHITEVMADELVEAGVSLAEMDELAAVFDGEGLPVALRYLAAARDVRTLASNIEIAASRIHGLVTAIKGHTYMDQADFPSSVDVAKGLSDTLTLLGGKARAKGVELRLEVEPALPTIEGFGGELNQVWSNLIDNAIDAVSKAGHVTVTASRDRQCIVVRVTDDGPGIPEDIKNRIFDPFFTTKGVGEGTGLGLAIVRRLIERHEGAVEVRSGPEGTEFRVTLPIARPRPQAAAEVVK